jgi:hypothetical protein
VDLDYCRAVLDRAGVTFDAGLTPSELSAAEHRYGFRFPPDLRAFLAFALPVGRGFPTWRDLESPELVATMDWPLEGMCFDIENNTFWPPEWGDRPADLQAAFAVARSLVARAPRLIPVAAGHRYLPDRPCEAGNPVFSVYQTDIIYYGSDLENYLHREFYYYFGVPQSPVASTIKEIEFWSWLVALNE